MIGTRRERIDRRNFFKGTTVESAVAKLQA